MKKIYLKKKIILRKKENIEDKVEYYFEIDKGKENNHNLYLGKDGKFAYQIYYLTKKKKN